MVRLIFFIAAFFLLTGSKKPDAEKATLIYIYDPMCGWCFGFSHILDSFKNKHADEFDYEIISGGMVVGDREGYIRNDLATYLESSYEKVENMAHIKYGNAFIEKLKNRELWLTSSIPTQALETFKKYKYEQANDFASGMQQAFFYDGKDMRDTNVYIQIIKKYQLNEKEFISRMYSDEIKKEAQMSYQTATNYGVNGYPSVIMEYRGKYYLITRGFVDYPTLEASIKKIIK
jgi:putative protein-disulfide isomerase